MKTSQKIKCYVFLVIAFFVFVSKANASLEISEIMYDPEGTDTNREWVKLYNNGEGNINIIGGKTASSWRIGDGDAGETLHYISDDLNVGAGEYVVIAKDKDTFISEYPSFTGSVSSASISLTNISGIVKIWDGASPRNLIVSREYSKGDSVDTDNDENDTVSESQSEEGDTADSTNSSSSSSSSSGKNEPKILKITANIIGKNIVVAGLALPLDSLVSSNRGTTFAIGRFVWNFGDGTVLENSSNTKFSHVYWYPGDYVLTLSYYKKHSVEPDAVDRVIVKVIPSGVYISSVGNITDPYVELENKSSYEINLSNWVIKSNTKSFTIPEGMILLPNKKIKLSSRATGFNIGDINFLNIINSNKEVMATYPNKINYKSSASNSSRNTSSKSLNTPSKDFIDNSNEQESNIINLNDLEANAINSNKNLNINYYILGLILIIGLGISSVFFLKKNMNDSKDELEDKITADNIKILE